jgi:7-cyano-7-deazaguanine synthase in queuosine biosynthesis
LIPLQGRMPKHDVYALTASSQAVPKAQSRSLIISDFPQGGTLSNDLDRLIRRVGEPLPVVRDFFSFAGSVYIADKKVLRKGSPDAWTREFRVSMPVADVHVWARAGPLLEDALSYLTGDRWSLRFRRGIERAQRSFDPSASFDAVHLFSGGLDSLIGAIDALANGKQLFLVGHHDSSLTESPQKALSRALAHEYPEQSCFVPVRVRAESGAGAIYPLPAATENSTRSRSLLFIAIGLVAASAFGPDVPLRMPENGFIALNVPLVPERGGSCSTRTAHPQFLAQLRQALDVLGITNQIENQYLFLTKGEMLRRCLNQSLVRSIAYDSVSCSHAEQARWDGKRDFPKNCGYCYPCIIRRAAFHAAGWDRIRSTSGSKHYRVNVCRQSYFVHQPIKGRDLRAVLSAIGAPREHLAPLLSGPVPGGTSIRDLSALYKKGLQELRLLFADKGSAELKSYAGI